MNKPTLGQSYPYYLTAEDLQKIGSQIENDRFVASRQGVLPRYMPDNHPRHSEGDIVALYVTAVRQDTVNGKLMLDGSGSVWVSEVPFSEIGFTPETTTTPEAGQSDNTAANDAAAETQTAPTE